MTLNSSDQFQRLQMGLPPSADSGLFGLDLEPNDAAIVILDVPWDATTSYRPGTSQAPEQIRRASHQLDLVDFDFGQIFLSGISFARDNGTIKKWNQETRPKVEKLIQVWENGGDPTLDNQELFDSINKISKSVTQAVYEKSKKVSNGKNILGVLGGDHSCSLGLLKFIGEKEGTFSVLQLDAHHDLREAYEGFRESHASIMFNALKDVPQIEKLVSVGIRDYSHEEMQLAKIDERIETFYDAEMNRRLFSGESFDEICNRIISHLGQKVYLTCDVDGLDPALCPHTGTPVPGGWSWHQWTFFLAKLANSGKKIIGFDLCEVGDGHNDEWNANVGARLLYKMCGVAIRTCQDGVAK